MTKFGTGKGIVQLRIYIIIDKFSYTAFLTFFVFVFVYLCFTDRNILIAWLKQLYRIQIRVKSDPEWSRVIQGTKVRAETKRIQPKDDEPTHTQQRTEITR